MENEETQTQGDGLSERFTPEQRADTVIKKWQAGKNFLIHTHYRVDIAGAIREAVEVEREQCAKIAESTANHTYEAHVGRVSKSIAAEIRARR